MDNFFITCKAMTTWMPSNVSFNSWKCNINLFFVFRLKIPKLYKNFRVKKKKWCKQYRDNVHNWSIVVALVAIETKVYTWLNGGLRGGCFSGYPRRRARRWAWAMIAGIALCIIRELYVPSDLLRPLITTGLDFLSRFS